jgi:hypothetical protein
VADAVSLKRLLSGLECLLAQLNEKQLRAALVRYVGGLPTTPSDWERLPVCRQRPWKGSRGGDASVTMARLVKRNMH